jgi:hypothetical protein
MVEAIFLSRQNNKAVKVQVKPTKTEMQSLMRYYRHTTWIKSRRSLKASQIEDFSLNLEQLFRPRV